MAVFILERLKMRQINVHCIHPKRLISRREDLDYSWRVLGLHSKLEIKKKILVLMSVKEGDSSRRANSSSIHHQEVKKKKKQTFPPASLSIVTRVAAYI